MAEQPQLDFVHGGTPNGDPDFAKKAPQSITVGISVRSRSGPRIWRGDLGRSQGERNCSLSSCPLA